MKKIVVVMPVANEEETMGELLDSILALPYRNLFIYPVVDSYSKDNTEKIIRSYESKTGRVKCIFYRDSIGVVSCYLEGFRQALVDKADYIIEMDGGGSHSPAELSQFIDKLNEGYDCVWGSRFVEGGGISRHPLYRKCLSAGGTIVSNLLLGTKLKDMTSGFEGFTREVLEKFDFSQFLSTGHMYQTEMRFYCRRYKSIEVPINYIGGDSSLKWQSIKEAICILFKLRKHEKKVMNVLSMEL